MRHSCDRDTRLSFRQASSTQGALDYALRLRDLAGIADSLRRALDNTCPWRDHDQRAIDLLGLRWLSVAAGHAAALPVLPQYRQPSPLQRGHVPDVPDVPDVPLISV